MLARALQVIRMPIHLKVFFLSVTAMREVPKPSLGARMERPNNEMAPLAFAMTGVILA